MLTKNLRTLGVAFGSLLCKAEWDESKHPRAEDGKFGEGGGGSGSKSSSPKMGALKEKVSRMSETLMRDTSKRTIKGLSDSRLNMAYSEAKAAQNEMRAAFKRSKGREGGPKERAQVTALVGALGEEVVRRSNARGDKWYK